MISILSAFKLIFITIAFAAEPNCTALFEEKPKFVNQMHDHISKVEELVHGFPHENPYFVINNNLQFRYFNVGQREELKLLGKHEFGIVSEQELKELREFFPEPLLEIQPTESNNYLVHRWVVMQNVARDFNSGLVKADDHFIRETLDEVIKNISLAHNPQNKAILFLDIDNLGIVNYFPGGHHTGDAYIKTITEVVSENLRNQDLGRAGDKDIGFKNYNGDEFFYLLDNVTAKEASEISKRIEEALNTDPRITIFKIKALGQFETFQKVLKSLRSYSELETVENLSSYILSRRSWTELSLDEKNEIQSSPEAFKNFISTYLHSEEVKTLTNNLGNIFLGGSFAIEAIKTGDTLESVLFRTCTSMEKCKMQKKAKQKRIEKESIYFPEI